MFRPQPTRADVRPQRNRPEDIIFHPPNGGAHSPIEAKILKGLGVAPGCWT
jgi:hypothetical protein